MDTTEEKLKERIKELTCLYDITTAILQFSDSEVKTLSDICDIVKQAYVHTAEAVVELSIGEHYLLTGRLPKHTVAQSAGISAGKEQVGRIAVHYPSQTYREQDFLTEERQLLDKVAHEIGNFWEKIRTEEKHQLLQRSIERADRLTILGEISAGIAHELNTPLGNILGFAELIKKQNQDRQIDQDLQKIISASIHSREIVKKMMFFSCEMPQHLENIEVTPVIMEALALLGPNFKKKQLTYKFDAPDVKIRSTIDSIQLTQVLFNLLINAIYASPEQAAITVSLLQSGNEVLIRVSDSGPGIPEGEKQRIFEPFFTTKPVGEGTGLGLSVVHGIVKSHRGTISVRDNSPSGAIFEIRLPSNT